MQRGAGEVVAPVVDGLVVAGHRRVSGDDGQLVVRVQRVVDAGEDVERAVHRKHRRHLEARRAVVATEQVRGDPQLASHEQQVRANTERRVFETTTQLQWAEALAELYGDALLVID